MKKIIIMCVFVAGFASCKAQSVTFAASYNTDKVFLNWSTDSNELIDRFEVEKSLDGVNFRTAALVFTSEKKGGEDYKFHEPIALTHVYYRVKAYGFNNKITVSKIVSVPVILREKKD
jgi:hypothetical protein